MEVLSEEKKQLIRSNELKARRRNYLKSLLESGLTYHGHRITTLEVDSGFLLIRYMKDGKRHTTIEPVPGFIMELPNFDLEDLEVLAVN